VALSATAVTADLERIEPPALPEPDGARGGPLRRFAAEPTSPPGVGILDYCKRLGVSLEPFIQVNYNAYLHAQNAFGSKPQRLRHVLSDFHGGVAELLAKAVSQDKLDQPVTAGQGAAVGGAAPMGGARRQLRLQGRGAEQRPAGL
jgi:hypothetical protein